MLRNKMLLMSTSSAKLNLGINNLGLMSFFFTYIN